MISIIVYNIFISKLNFLRNAVCETRSSRSAELLARYSDSILKKNAKVASDDSDKEAAMSEVVSILVPAARFKSFGKRNSYTPARSKVGEIRDPPPRV